MAALYGDSDAITQQDLSRILRAVSAGESIQWQGAELDPQTRFYVLGLSPNEGRLSVRFFYQNSFGGMLRHIEEHYERLEIQRPAFDQTERLPLWKLLAETVNQKSREKTASPQMAGDLLRAHPQREPVPFYPAHPHRPAHPCGAGGDPGPGRHLKSILPAQPNARLSKGGFDGGTQ